MRGFLVHTPRFLRCIMTSTMQASSMSSQPSSRIPLIAILGATGTGKSRLAVYLAKHLNGEVINSDALQLYAGLPITTNKITTHEQQGIPHHLLGCVPLSERSWTVGRFTAEAARIIESVRARGKVPIVVGGTGYYLQSLVFREALVAGNLIRTGLILDVSADSEGMGDTGEEQHGKDGFLSTAAEEERWPILAARPEIMLSELRRVDPIMAGRWHPNDKRKIRRSLAIYLHTGRRASEIYAEQEAARMRLGSLIKELTVDEMHGDEDDKCKGMKYDTLFLWAHAEPSVLEARLEKRVEEMCAAGLLDEIEYMRTIHDTAIANGEELDETRGIWVAIGYKEFGTYLDALNRQEKSQDRNCDLGKGEQTCMETLLS